MLRKNIHFLYGVGIGILLVALVIFNHYRNSQPQEPVIIYKETLPAKQVSKTAKPLTSPEATTQPVSKIVEEQDIKESWDTEIGASTEALEEEFPSEQDEFAGSSEPLPTTQTEELLKEDFGYILLKEVFPELDRLLRETQELAEDMKGMTPENFAAFETRGKALEAELQDYCLLIAEEFPGAVTFITFQGEEWAYDIDFRMLQVSLGDTVPPELEPYFRYARLREMFGLPDISPDQLEQLQ